MNVQNLTKRGKSCLRSLHQLTSLLMASFRSFCRRSSRRQCRRRFPGRLHPHSYSTAQRPQDSHHFAGSAQTCVISWPILCCVSSSLQNTTPRSCLKPLRRSILTFTSCSPRFAHLPGSQEFACNGTLVDDPEMGEVIQLQGDQRAKISSFLIENGIDKATVKVHGF
jgi:hypothetical protein